MTILLTGIAGFIGSNVADYFASQGHEIIGVDNLSRPGVMNNLKWLNHKITFYERSIARGIHHIIRVHKPDVIFHFAGQVGVQSSISDPRADFEVNALGTFNLLENVRISGQKPLIVFASTNKVYGDIQVDKPVSETQPLSFCTPYGCSKGAADQYMLDYFRVYQIPTVVLRMSCIYGNRQWGQEEQGWLCHFARNVRNHVTIYGDGTQVRDALYIDDYVKLMGMLVEQTGKVQGKVFNIGGGIENAISVNEALQKIGNTHVSYADWRPSDQRYYVSDITKIKETIGWKPEIGVDEGLERLKVWVKSL